MIALDLVKIEPMEKKYASLIHSISMEKKSKSLKW